MFNAIIIGERFTFILMVGINNSRWSIELTSNALWQLRAISSNLVKYGFGSIKPASQPDKLSSMTALNPTFSLGAIVSTQVRKECPASALIPLSRRDYFIQPRVARNELPG